MVLPKISDRLTGFTDDDIKARIDFRYFILCIYESLFDRGSLDLSTAVPY